MEWLALAAVKAHHVEPRAARRRQSHRPRRSAPAQVPAEGMRARARAVAQKRIARLRSRGRTGGARGAVSARARFAFVVGTALGAIWRHTSYEGEHRRPARRSCEAGEAVERNLISLLVLCDAAAHAHNGGRSRAWSILRKRSSATPVSSDACTRACHTLRWGRGMLRVRLDGCAGEPIRRLARDVTEGNERGHIEQRSAIRGSAARKAKVLEHLALVQRLRRFENNILGCLRASRDDPYEALDCEATLVGP
jgi:hypothetical protein